MNHALIIADIEGVAGVYNLEDTDECSKKYTQEIEICIAAMLANGVDKVTVCDAHDKGNLIDPKVSQLNGNVRLVSQVNGIPFDCKYDFALLVGFHGMEGSPGILPHTLRFDFKEIVAVNPKNGLTVPVGEVEIYTRWLGSYGIPVVLVAGDREAVYEANCFNPYRQTCCIKSYYQTNHIGSDFFHSKLSKNIFYALQLDKELCLSPDDSEILIEFHNPDITKALAGIGYQEKNGRISFQCCSDLVSNLYVLAEHLKELNREIWATNVEFLQTVRTMVQPINRADLEESDVGQLLSKNLMLLDSASREAILSKLQSLI